jgi:hypothetical protein
MLISKIASLLFVEDEAPGEDVDPFELLEAVDILALLPKDFYDKIVSIAINYIVVRLAIWFHKLLCINLLWKYLWRVVSKRSAKAVTWNHN